MTGVVAGEQQMASLLVRQPESDSPKQCHLLEKQETFLGRDPACDIVIPSLAVSRRHARIIRVGDCFYVEDMDTPGGTRVNGPEVGNQIRGRTLLRDKDEIWFPTAVVQFRE